MVNLNTIYTDRAISLNVPQLNVPNSSFRSSTTGPLANYRADQVKSSMGTQQSAGPYAALPNHTPPTASVNNHPQQQPTAATTLGAPANTLPTIHSMGSFISAVGNPGSPGTDSNENDLAFLIQRIQNGKFTLRNSVKILKNFKDLSKLQSAINQRDTSSSTDLSDIRVNVLPKNSTPL